MRNKLIILFVLFVLLITPTSGLAQNYYFQLPQFTVNVFFNADGSQSVDYVYVFNNEWIGHAIEYVDVSYQPDTVVDVGSIQADIDGKPITDISESGYLGTGRGVAIGLGANSIKAGKSGTVHVYIGKVERVLYDDTEDKDYASAGFSPAYFESNIVHGNTDLTFTFHFPPGVQPEEPKWHIAPAGFPKEPETGFDDAGNIIYTWRNPKANAYTEYRFGASFPKKYVPESAIVRTTFFEAIAGLVAGVIGMLSPCLMPLCFVGFFVAIIYWSARSNQQRKLQYLPPRIAIEGHGIKRGLTAVEAAILMEQPLDKILTMLLFGAIKKNAAQVKTRDPLELDVSDPLPDGLHEYESNFLKAFQKTGPERRRALQEMVINLVKSVSEKMKGFSRRETVDYYRDIIKRAWAQVETAATPEVKAQKYDEVMEWTILDGDFNDRTRNVFRTGPVYVPIWWGRYDPVFRQTSSTAAPTPSVKMPGIPSVGSPMPNLPGADFAASVVNGVQSFASSVVGNVTDFTSGITQKTNPVPVTTSSSRGGSRSSGSGGRSCACACACACAGCACACAGGGR